MRSIAIVYAAISLATGAQAALKPGDSLHPYDIKNVGTGQQYCQVCAYGAKAGKIVAFGKLHDEAFWKDLKRLQNLQDSYKNLGVFAQVIDSKDAKAIRTQAEKNGIKFPVVIAVEKNWDKIYKIHGKSRVIYYAQRDDKIVWTSTSGLDEKSTQELDRRVKKDLAS